MKKQLGRWVLVLSLIGWCGGHTWGKTATDLEGLKAKKQKVSVKGQFWAAFKLAKKILKGTEATYKPGHPKILAAVLDLARLSMTTGDYGKAIELYVRGLAMTKKLKGDPSKEGLRILQQLYVLYSTRSEYTLASKTEKEITAGLVKIHGKGSMAMILQLQMMAGMALSQNAYERAEVLYLETLRFFMKTYPNRKTSWVSTLTSLAMLYWQKGDAQRGEATFERIRKIYATAMHANDYAKAVFYTSLSQSYRRFGRVKRALGSAKKAESILHSAIAKTKKKFGENHVMVLSYERSLASLYVTNKFFDKALPLVRSILKRSAKASFARTMGEKYQLVQIYQGKKEYKKAILILKYLRKVQVAKWGKALAMGPNSMLAQLYMKQGNLKKAKKLVLQAYREMKALFGENHPSTNGQLEWLALLEMRQGHGLAALKIYQKSLIQAERQITWAVGNQSEGDTRALLKRMTYQLNMLLVLQQTLLPNDENAARLAMDTILRRKGRALDAATDRTGLLKKRLTPSQKKLYVTITKVRSQLARLVVAGPKATAPGTYGAKIAGLQQKLRRLEAQLRSVSHVFRAQHPDVTTQRVAKAIPDDSVLLEWVLYRYYDRTKHWDQQKEVYRYAVYILTKGQDTPAWHDLGPAGPIDTMVKSFLKSLKTADSVDVEEKGKKLYTTLFKPLEHIVAGKKHLIVSPDSLLNLLPFGAMMDPAGRYLIRRFVVTYLTSGRDLLRSGSATQKSAAPVIFANPDFSGKAVTSKKTGDTSDSTSRGRRSIDLGSTMWKPLPGTRDEATALARILPDAQLRMGAKATESALKSVSAPRILHVATHGFFLPDQPSSLSSSGSRGGGAGSAVENPLLRSGLVLSSANVLSSGEDDGILTALEATGLDLLGTKLVVLSACETGVGKVTAGAGVYGLRRALVIAGAESLLMSLWQVDDQATRQLMTGFYTALSAGMGRSKALRKVQLKMIRDEKYRHPFYWAAFFLQGASGKMTPR